MTITKTIHPEITCKMFFHTYPFDEHTCHFMMVTIPGEIRSWYSDGADVGFYLTKYQNTGLEYDFKFSSLPREKEHIQMYDSDTPESIRKAVDFHQIKCFRSAGFSMKIKRVWIRHLLIYFLPSSLFVLTSWVSFIIPPKVNKSACASLFELI